MKSLQLKEFRDRISNSEKFAENLIKRLESIEKRIKNTSNEENLIPRKLLFGNPKKAQARISPDGEMLAYLAPSKEKDVLNVWLKSIGKDDDRMITNDTLRGIRSYFWSEDGTKILYIQDAGGDENWHVYGVDLVTGIVRDYTPFEGIRAQNIQLDRNFPEQMLVGLNIRDRRVFDMYRIDLNSGAVELDTKNSGDVLNWITDIDFIIRGAVAMNPETGAQTLRVREREDTEWKDLITWPQEENGSPIEFSQDGESIFVGSSLNSDTIRLIRISTYNAEELECLAENEKCDFDTVVVHPETHAPQAVSFNYMKKEWIVLDKEVEEDFNILNTLFPDCEYEIVSRDHRDKKWIIACVYDDQPVTYNYYNRETKEATYLFSRDPELANYKMSKRKPILIKTSDNLELVSYLTLPLDKEPKNLPLILNIHGGPWARDQWGFCPVSQWFANRGYATLQVNFRSSTGFGKTFLHAGDKQWGIGKIQDDLTESVQWAINEGIADPSRICCYGGSFGGYATLAGLTFTPDLYACGIDIVGPSNIKTLFGSIPPYWAPMKKLLTLRVGDVENDEEFNKKISPLFHIHNIRVPLLIGQGRNDPRVNVAESDQIFNAMKEKGLSVEYIIYDDEGHGFARPENRLDFFQRCEMFLKRHLGGRAEPMENITGTSASVIH